LAIFTHPLLLFAYLNQKKMTTKNRIRPIIFKIPRFAEEIYWIQNVIISLFPRLFIRPITYPDKRSTFVTSAERAETQENPRAGCSSFLGEFAKLRKVAISFVNPSVRLHGTPRPSLDGFS
jgi:hypothetical protein